MTWDAYDARTLREADDVIDTATCMLVSMRDVLKMLVRGHPNEVLSDQIAMIDEAIEVGRTDHDRIEEALANTPEGRAAYAAEQPDMPIVCRTVRL